jgi:hypothetical protein
MKEALEESERGKGRKNEGIFIKSGPKSSRAVLPVREDRIS